MHHDNLLFLIARSARVLHRTLVRIISSTPRVFLSGASRARFAGNSGAIAKNCNAAAAAQEQPNVEIILTRVLRVSLSTTGAAVLFTAVMVIAGIIYWIPGSSLRFNSEMAMLLLLLMTSNLIGAVTVLPALVRIIKPRFVLDEHQDDAKVGDQSSRMAGRTGH